MHLGQRFTIIIIVFYIFSVSKVFAQNKIEGQVFDSGTKQPLEFSVVVLENRQDTTKPMGTLTDENGKFIFMNLENGTYQIKINLVGYKAKSLRNIVLSGTAKTLPPIWVEPDVKQLEDVVVIGEKQDLTLQIDKKVYEIDKNLVAVGGSAMDAITQIPSVTTDMDGNIQVRGSGALQVWINGKPSALTGANRQAILDQIPASAIERVELITNPSSRYDAEGSAGILNIILKKNRSDGMSGSVAVGVSTRQARLGIYEYDPKHVLPMYFDVNKYNGAASYNNKKGKFNISSNLGIRENPTWMSVYNYRNNIRGETEFDQYENGENRINTSGTASISTDYTINEKNTITLDLVGGAVRAKEWRILNYYFYNRNTDERFYRVRATKQDKENINGDVGLSWRRTFSKKGKELFLSSNYSARTNYSPNYFSQYDFADEAYTVPINRAGYTQSRNINYGGGRIWVTHLDYNLPVNEIYSIEVGAKQTFNSFNNVVEYDTLTLAGTYSRFPLLSNDIEFSENISAFYGTVKINLGRQWALQTGLRTEFTEVLAQSSGQDNSYFYWRPFPSMYFIKKYKAGNEFKISYSRRINRPDYRALNTVPIFTDPLNLLVGNANIRPDDIHSGEVSYLLQLTKASVTNTVYYRHILNPITRYRTVDPVRNVFVLSSYNLDYEQNLGHEMVLRYEFSKNWNATLSTNLFAVRLVGNLFNEAIDTRNYMGNVRFVSNLKIWKGTDIQVNGNYMAPRIMPQGTFQAWNGVDIGLRQELIKRKAFLNVNISDVFNTRNITVRMRNDDLRSVMIRKPETRIVTATFTYRFGKDLKQPVAKKTRKDGFEGSGANGGLME